MKHIFVVDDEKNIRNLIEKYFEKEGFKVSVYENGENLLENLEAIKPDLLVLDIMMPGTDGLELCKKIRAKSEMPIIFVSAKDEEIDKILGIEIGGDDYLTKPFSPKELVVRAKRLLKRIDKNSSYNNDKIVIKDIEMFTSRRYIEKNEFELKLTTKEYDLFEFLVRNKNMPFTREQLLEKVWGYDYLGDERIIDDLIKRLRKKLKTVNSILEITTVWGYGYKING